MSAAPCKPPASHQPGPGLALLLAVLVIMPISRGALADTKPATITPTTVRPTTMLKPPVQSAATGDLKTNRQALLKQRTSVTGLANRHPGKIVGATTGAPKTIATKRFLPK